MLALSCGVARYIRAAMSGIFISIGSSLEVKEYPPHPPGRVQPGPFAGGDTRVIEEQFNFVGSPTKMPWPWSSGVSPRFWGHEPGPCGGLRSFRWGCHADGVIERKKSERTAIQEVIERLTHKHLDLSPQTIADVVQKMHTKFDGRPVRDFVPLFVERNAHAELTKLNA